MGTILQVFQEIVTFDLRAARGEIVGTVFLEVGTARKKALRLDCCCVQGTGGRLGGLKLSVSERREEARGDRTSSERERTWLGTHRWGHPGLFLLISQWQ